jgi:hypothetical protein
MDISFAHCDLFRDPVRINNITTDNITLYVSKMNNYEKVNDANRNPMPNNGIMFHESMNNYSDLQSETTAQKSSSLRSSSNTNQTNTSQTPTNKANHNPLQQRYPWRKGKWSDEEEVRYDDILSSLIFKLFHLLLND